MRFLVCCVLPDKKLYGNCLSWLNILYWKFFHLALRNSLPWNFSLHWVYFYIQDFWASCACPEKQNVPWIHCIEYMFLSFRIFEHLALALKNRVDLKIFPVLKYFLSFRTFEQLALALKTEFALNSLYWIYIFYHSGFLNNLRLPWKTQIALKFFTVLKYFLSFRIFEHLVLALKTGFALKLFKTGGAAAPHDPRLVRLWLRV